MVPIYELRIDPFTCMPDEHTHPYQLDEPFSNFRVVGLYFPLLNLVKANSGEPDQIVASD